MKRLNLVKWSILIASWITSLISLIVISIYAVSFFNYAFLALATIAFTLTIWYVFKQKEDEMPIE